MPKFADYFGHREKFFFIYAQKSPNSACRRSFRRRSKTLLGREKQFSIYAHKASHTYYKKLLVSICPTACYQYEYEYQYALPSAMNINMPYRPLRTSICSTFCGEKGIERDCGIFKIIEKQFENNS